LNNGTNYMEILMQLKWYSYNSNIRLFCGLLALAFFCLTALIGLPGNIAAAEDLPQTTSSPEVKLLEGSWVRPDGGYILELKNIDDDGTLSAAYFNPRPIKVFQAFWATDEGRLAVFVELRDINYPGSKYNLRYDPATDRLQGSYFQAIEQQVYEIEFFRKK